MFAFAKKFFVLSLAAFLMLFALTAFAQDLAQPPPDIGVLLTQALAVLMTWKGAGAIAGVIALTNLLTNLTKLPILDGVFGKLWYLRPALSLIFGMISGVLASVVAGTPVASAILAGLIAGLASTGFHELMTQFNEKTKTERAVGSTVVSVLTSSLKVEEMKTSLDAASKITDPKERLAALAAWANKEG